MVCGRPTLTLRDEAVVILLLEVRDVHPEMGHLVDRAVPIPDPLLGIRVVRVIRRVVVQRCNNQRRPLREERLVAVRVDVVVVPVLLEVVDDVDHFLPAIRISPPAV